LKTPGGEGCFFYVAARSGAAVNPCKYSNIHYNTLCSAHCKTFSSGRAQEVIQLPCWDKINQFPSYIQHTKSLIE